MKTKEILVNAKNAVKYAATLCTKTKNEILHRIADSLCENCEKILTANKIDVNNATGKINAVMIDRLTLTEARIKAMANGIKEVALLPDPVGEVISSYDNNGLNINKISVPLGVVAIIYESRPNVTSDAAALALKSGNVCILRGGKEAYNTNRAITDIMRETLKKFKLNPDLINLIDDTSRESATELMTAVGYVDLLIPRGGAGLIKACTENAKVPCIQTGTGICHIYVDEFADFEKAINIIDNAKTSRPSVCNAAEVCLVNENIAEKFLPLLKKRLVDDNNKKVELRLDENSLKIIDGTPATASDFDTEFLDYVLAVKTVNSADDAIKHISLHSTGHSEAIITENEENAKHFTKLIDSAAVYVNASTRFTDGGEFGLGCEMGISTQKLHARGPMGLKELNTYKYVIIGNGNIR